MLKEQSGPSASRRVSLALISLGATSALIGLRLVATRSPRAGRFDLASVQDGLSQLAKPRAERATALLLDTISIASLGLVGATLIAFALARGRRNLAAACALLLVGAPLTAELLKRDLEPRLNVPSHLAHSFPSGHATIALSLGLALILVAPSRVRLAAATVAALYATAVGTALVVGGWHFPSDVAGGFCVATAWAAAAAFVAHGPLEQRPPARLAAALLFLVAGAGTTAVIVRPGIVVRAQLHLALVEATLGIAAAATVCAAAVAYATAARNASTTRS